MLGVIEYQFNFLRPIAMGINIAQILAAYFTASFTLWVLGFYTTLTQPGGYISSNGGRAILWCSINGFAYVYKLIFVIDIVLLTTKLGVEE
jgi:hypothetical protein